MNTAHHVEVACTAFLRWLVAVCGHDTARTVLLAMADHLTATEGEASDPVRSDVPTLDS
jgi:hypothetical protein